MPDQPTNDTNPQPGAPVVPAPPTPSPAAVTAPVAETPAPLDQPTAAEEATIAQIAQGDETTQSSNDQPAAAPEEPLVWQASEYVHHDKGIGWYALLAIAVIILLLVAIVLKLWLSIGVFLAMAAAIVVYARKPPRVLEYRVDSSGITIADKTYPYSTFRSYAVLRDLSWHTIDLEPTQRFMPRLSVLFGEEDLEAIVAHLSAHLPRVDRDPDLVERLSRYLRF
ncbi:MAG TPA: hypothetical protein VLI05_05995 [Candidatus Saccharimonadia bacterium]|nr:hypothetical protein [Candidatus Saccharimonadia bacterium]